MADVTRDQLTAALERLGWTVTISPTGIGGGAFGPYSRVTLTHDTEATVERIVQIPMLALAAALRELCPLDVLVRGVMDLSLPIHPESDNMLK